MNSAAWPACPAPLASPIRFDALHCSDDNRVRVATIGREYFVSVDGDSFAGPLKTFDAAREYGASIAKTEAA